VWRKYWCMLGIGVLTVGGFPWVCLLMLVRWSANAGMGYVKTVWARQMLWLPGATLRVEGLENCDMTKPTVFVSNHQSTLDIPALLVALPLDFRFVSKKVIKYVPVLGWYMTMAGFIFIERGQRKAAIKTLGIAAEKIRRGTSILMFPEGTRSETGQVLPFKKGPFALALQAGVQVCPIAVEGSRHVMPKNSWNVVPGQIRVKIGHPIDPKPFGDDRAALAAYVRERVIELNLELGGPGGDRVLKDEAA
jgi:1-acyl-sn-glycerol-3-phosphate acyltransferase